MSTELNEMVESLLEEKNRYLMLEQESMGKLLELSIIEKSKLTDELLHERSRVEEEIQMLRKLINYINFKLKVLNVNEYAS